MENKEGFFPRCTRIVAKPMRSHPGVGAWRDHLWWPRSPSSKFEKMQRQSVQFFIDAIEG
jgi:hypothetical protein